MPITSFDSTPVDDLIPYVNNARTHSDEQVAQIAASIREFGFTNPLLITPDKSVIAGHGRLAAARKLGLTVVPTITIDGLSDAQTKALVIADNSLALNAGWDNDLLKMELEGLLDDQFDIDLLGLEGNFLDRLLVADGEGLTDEDATPEAPAEPVAKAGDVWLLGEHRLVCGDSTDADTVAQCLNGVTPHLMVTDPPYGVNYDASWREEAGSGGRAVGKVLNDDNADWREAWALFPGDVAYVWHATTKVAIVEASLAACDFTVRAQIIWAKNNIVIGRGHYHRKHEPCLYAVRNGRTGHWCGDRKQSTVWNIDKSMRSETGHSTQKPVECMLRPIINNSSAGQAVYEPFSGSGTTIIACEKSGRVCHAIELNPVYVDIAVKRWEEYTGQVAVLEVVEEVA